MRHIRRARILRGVRRPTQNRLRITRRGRTATNTATPACLFCRPDDPSANVVIGSLGTMYARWDNFPAGPGHLEIVPYRHIGSFFELSASEVRHLHQLAGRMKKQLDADMRPDGFTIGVNDGPAAGRTVPHLHLHIIPRWTGDVPDPRGGIRQILPGCDPDTWC